MPVPPRPRFPEDYTREDQLQEYALTAARCPDASPATIKRYTRERWEEYDAASKRQTDPTLTADQLRDAGSWDTMNKEYHMPPVDLINARTDLKRDFQRLKAKWGDLICDAAAREISVKECAKLLHMRESVVAERVRQADDEARALLERYRRED